jgi:hypothetical protein
MSKQEMALKKCKQINGHKGNQQGLVKGGSNDN